MRYINKLIYLSVYSVDCTRVSSVSVDLFLYLLWHIIILLPYAPEKQQAGYCFQSCPSVCMSVSVHAVTEKLLIEIDVTQ